MSHHIFNDTINGTLRAVHKKLNSVKLSLVKHTSHLQMSDNHSSKSPSPKPSSREQRGSKQEYNRRATVFSEPYDPSANEDESEQMMVHPKTEDQISRLNNSIKDVFLLKSLDEGQKRKIVDAMCEVKFSAGDIIISEGDDNAENFYVIDKGTYKIFQNKNDHTVIEIGQYTDRGSFGELALMYNVPRSATVTAVTDGTLWALDRKTFRKIVCKAAYDKRKEYDNLLKAMPLLDVLTEYERMTLADALVTKCYKDKQSIIQQGDEADGMYFIEEGNVQIIIENLDGDIIYEKKLQKGKYFGELALLNKKTRSASVYADGPCRCAVLEIKQFERLLGPCMELLKRNAEIYNEVKSVQNYLN